MLKMLLVKRKLSFPSNLKMSQIRRATTSSSTRKTFLSYFGQHASIPHVIVKSSKVAPPSNDPTLSFVNAGMNSFKRIIEGQAKPPGCQTVDGKSSVANSQKCVRVGGKHNDLECVGTDGSHHTFFEMLGNWAFNQAYFKKEACSMAWQLLTGPYQLPKEKLYVTYFGGSPQVAADLETRNIWLELGLDASHILPFSAKDNFWEMGAKGPCGPCSEIHFDHYGLGPQFVNAGRDDLVEIWNLVFMQYNRKVDGSLEPLPQNHVDTGMGLERLTAVINNKTSNYDTDLFSPLFDVIARQTKAPTYSGLFDKKLDTDYRILADHSRMLSVCLSDGMFPDSSPKLKQVLRRAIRLARQSFLMSSAKPKYNEFHLLNDLMMANCDILGESYPELVSNLDRVKLILEFETESLRQQDKDAEKFWPKFMQEYPEAVNLVDMSDCKHFYEGLKFLDKQAINSNQNDGHAGAISGHMAYKMYDTLGLKEDDIEIIASLKGLSFSREDFKEAFSEVKNKSKVGTALKSAADLKNSKLESILPTDDSYKFVYSRSPSSQNYEFQIVSGAKILALTGPNLQKTDVLTKGEDGIIFLDKTSFYSESGGQIADIGEIVNESGAVFSVTDCQQIGGNLIGHIGKVKRGRFSTGGGQVDVKINHENRLKLMQAHTCTHLLNAVLHNVLPLTCQKSSLVGPGHFKFDFAVFKQSSFGPDMIHLIEEKVNTLIASKQPVTREVLSSSEELSKFENFDGLTNTNDADINFQHDNNNTDINDKKMLVPKRLITIPGERYPEENLSLIHTPISIEPCCGTHVFNTEDIQGFVITGIKSLSTGVRSLKCVVGSESVDIRQKGLALIDTVVKIRPEVNNLLQMSVESSEYLPLVTNLWKRVSKLEKSLADNKLKIPFSVRVQLAPIVAELSKTVKSCNRTSKKLNMENEMRSVIEISGHLPFVIHCFAATDGNSVKVNLSKLTQLCQDKPVLLVAHVEEGLSARACVPSHLVSDCFNAKLWLKALADVVGGQVAAPKTKDLNCIVNMKPVQVADQTLIDKALKNVLDLAEAAMTK